MTRKSHYINNTKMLLMLASTIRFSNHYQTPPTSSHEPVTTTQQVGLSAETTPNTGFVMPGPNNVPVPAPPPTARRGSIPSRAASTSKRWFCSALEHLTPARAGDDLGC